MSLRKRLVVPVAIALGLLLIGAGPAPASVGGFDNVVVFATNSVRLSSDVGVTSGDIVVNQQSAGPTLGNGFELYVDRKSTVAGNAKADSIKVFQQAKILGTVFFNDLSNSGTVGGQVTPLLFPVLSPLPPFVTGQPRGQDVSVLPGGSVQLAPGAFKNVTGGDFATIVFTGGVYDLQSIDVQNDVTLVFGAPSEVRISGKFRTRRRAVIGPAPGCQTPAAAPCSASDVVFYVAGINGSDGALGSTPEAARIGSDSAVSANFYAPNGTLRMEVNTLASGAFLGKDVMLDRGSQVSLKSAFVNKPPTAYPKTVEGVAGPTTIELSGSDPEGGSLTFSDPVPVPPTKGTLGPITPIQDPGQCSQTVQACTSNSQCPGTETCILPPITRATVLYTPTNCTSDGCPADSFTFGVTDDCGALATAVVQINPNDPSGPPPPLNAVAADDLSVDVPVDSVSNITLSAGAPPSVASLAFAVHTVPLAGTIKDEFGNPITVTNVPYQLPSAIVVYAAPGSAGTANFTFSARDAATSLPCLSPACDTGTVNISFAERAPLAQPLSVETALNTPIQITLQGNPGGVGTGGSGPQAQQSVSSPGYTYFYEAQPIGDASGNGNPSASVTHETPEKRKGLAAPQAQAIPSGSIPLTHNAGWSATAAVPPAFFWTGTVPVFACDDNESACQGVFTFTGAGCLSVTDDFLKGDQFRIYDNGSPIFTTTAVAVDAGAFEVGPDAAYLDPTYSSGSFYITGTGSHAIAIEAIGSSFASGRGYIRVDTGSCQPNLEVTSFSAPASAALDQAIGSQILATVMNTGSSVIPAGTLASIGYYISSDSTITTADRLLQGGRENLSQQAPGGLAIGQSVQINLFTGAAIGSQFPDAEPLTGNVFIGVLVDEFNEVAETDEADNTASAPIAVAASTGASLVYTITSLPPASRGTLTTLSGAPIAQFQTFTGGAPTVVFQPAPGISGSTSFTYSVTEAAVSATATVGILVALNDDCAFNGRPLGCSTPGGGGAGPQSQASQEAFEREVAAGPSKGLTVVVEGSGSVATSPVPLSGNRVLMGLICHGGTCNKRLPEGAEIALFARPEGDDSEFVRWSGACWGSEPITTVRLTEHTLCTAVFGEKTID